MRNLYVNCDCDVFLIYSNTFVSTTLLIDTIVSKTGKIKESG